MRSRGVLRGGFSVATLICFLGFVASAQSRVLDAVVGENGLQGSSVRGTRLLQTGVLASSRSGEGLHTVSEGGANGLALTPLSSAETVRSREAAEIPDAAYEDDEDWSDDDSKKPPKLVPTTNAGKNLAVAPAVKGLDTGAFPPALSPASATQSGVKRVVSSQAGEEEGDDLEREGRVAGNDTQPNRSLNDTRSADGGVKNGAKPTPSPTAATRAVSTNGTSETFSTEEEPSANGGDSEENDDEEGGQNDSENDPPRLSHRTSSWEGFGDPSKKLTLVVVCSNVGGGVLNVKVIIPTWIRADPESVPVPAGEERNITITVLDPKGLKSASERIQIQSNGGDEYFEITSAALGRSDWTEGLPGSGGSSGTLLAAGSGAVILAVVGLFVWRRRQQRHGGAGFKYKELEMQGDRDLSSALGQLPAGAGMAMSYSSGYGGNRGSRTPTGDNSNRGWDDNWDDWDEEEQRSKR